MYHIHVTHFTFFFKYHLSQEWLEGLGQAVDNCRHSPVLTESTDTVP